MTTYCLWQGSSVLTGQPIAVVMTDGSRNRKTGDMSQVYIINQDVNPASAIKTGEDAAVCGDCPLRGICYVAAVRGPYVVFKKFAAGATIPVDNLAALGRGRLIRVGAWGDPAAVPTHVWEALLSKARGHTGYTHQWRKFPELKAWFHASVDTPAEREEAKSMGWFTYRIKLTEEAREAGERPCPAIPSKNKVQCRDCLGCAGSGRGRDFVISAHGVPHKVKAYREFRLSREATK